VLFLVVLGKRELRAKFKVASFSRCRNIIEEPQNLGSSLAQSHAHFSSGFDFMMGLGKPKLYTKYEVASFNRCRILNGNSQIFWGYPSPGPLSPLDVIL